MAHQASNLCSPAASEFDNGVAGHVVGNLHFGSSSVLAVGRGIDSCETCSCLPFLHLWLPSWISGHYSPKARQHFLCRSVYSLLAFVLRSMPCIEGKHPLDKIMSSIVEVILGVWTIVFIRVLSVDSSECNCVCNSFTRGFIFISLYLYRNNK
jgi:hypothetical protein